MRTTKISIEDIINVAESISTDLSIGEITHIMDEYDGAEADDPTSNFSEIIENLIYGLDRYPLVNM